MGCALCKCYMCRMCAHLQTKCAHAEKPSMWDTFTPNIPNIDQGRYWPHLEDFLYSSERLRAADLQTKWAHVEKSSPSGRSTPNILRHNVKTQFGWKSSVKDIGWKSSVKDNLGSNVLSASWLFDETFLQVSVEGHPRKALGQQLVLHSVHFFDICREISIISISLTFAEKFP